MSEWMKIPTIVCALLLVVASAGCGSGEPVDQQDAAVGPADTGADIQMDSEAADGSGDADAGDTGDAGDAEDAGDADNSDVVRCMDNPEECNEEDDNCNGVVDEGCTCVYDDNETGVCADGTIGEQNGECQPPESYESDETSCDDELDNDCDGLTNEGCACQFDDSSQGVCANGVISDEDGSCQEPDDYLANEDGYQNPDAHCDGLDNDCDGVADEGCSCNYDNSDQGVCTETTRNYVDGTCQKPLSYASNETTCDGKDNDCDGTVDESCSCIVGSTESCYTGPSGTADIGACSSGTRECLPGDDGSSWGECSGDTLPEGEICDDGIDNDCDGDVDMADDACTCAIGDTQSCYTGPSGTQGVGVCTNGTQDCVQVNDGSEWGACSGDTLPEGEMCNDGLDNDCDGDTDGADNACICTLGDTQSCYTGPSGTQGVGACSDGTQTCVQANDGSGWGACSGDTLPEGEICDDGIDNDCDGDVDMADDTCTCTIGDTQSCYTGPSGTQGVGACSDGTQTCVQANDGSEWGTCSGQTTPQLESCGDSVDNDCDGDTDESGTITEDFEGSDSNWSKFNNGSGTVNVDTNASQAHNGSESGKAAGPNQGVCGQGGLSKSFSFSQSPNQMTVWIKASTDGWGRVTIMLQDSTGIHTLWREKGGGSDISMGWTQKTFNLSSYDSDFTLIFGNDDNSQHCSNGDHDWTLWVDDITLDNSCSSP